MPQKPYLSDKDADAVFQAATDAARESGVPMCIALVDEAGQLLRFARLEGTPLISLDVSMAKATTAARLRMSTTNLASHVAESPSLLALPGALPFPGGLPIFLEGQFVGAIGVSGGSADQDEQVARKGIEGLS